MPASSVTTSQSRQIRLPAPIRNQTPGNGFLSPMWPLNEMSLLKQHPRFKHEAFGNPLHTGTSTQCFNMCMSCYGECSPMLSARGFRQPSPAQRDFDTAFGHVQALTFRTKNRNPCFLHEAYRNTLHTETSAECLGMCKSERCM